MTDEDKKLVFEYMGWCPKTRNFCNGKARATFCPTLDDCHQHPLDGNDMVAAMNKMWPDDYKDFTFWMITYKNIEGLLRPVLMQPARFFELMAAWLKEKEHEKSY